MLKSLVTVGLLACSVSVYAQTAPQTAAQSADNCIVAGRMNDQDKLSQAFAGVELLNAQGKVIGAVTKSTLDSIKQVRVSKPALLASCNGASALKPIDPQAGASKPTTPVVTASATPIAVEKVSLLGLKTGGSLVELQIALAADRLGSK